MITNQGQTEIAIRLGQCEMNISIEHEELLTVLQQYITEPGNQDELISVGTYEKEQYLDQFPASEWNAYAEHKCLLNLVSDYMMKFDQFLFHSVAVTVKGKTWLLSGPSGIGKSTQYRNLKKQYPDEIEIISGDNPVLSFVDNRIIVYPSPWNGKENWHSSDTGILNGIVMLEQSGQNRYCALTPSQVVIPVYREIDTYAKTEEQIHLVAEMERKLIRTVPIFRFENTGDPESSEFLYRCLTIA